MSAAERNFCDQGQELHLFEGIKMNVYSADRNYNSSKSGRIGSLLDFLA